MSWLFQGRVSRFRIWKTLLSLILPSIASVRLKIFSWWRLNLPAKQDEGISREFLLAFPSFTKPSQLVINSEKEPNCLQIQKRSQFDCKFRERAKLAVYSEKESKYQFNKKNSSIFLEVTPTVGHFRGWGQHNLFETNHQHKHPLITTKTNNTNHSCTTTNH